MRAKILGLVFVLLLLLPSALGQVEVSVEPVKDTIIPSGEAAFDLLISNRQKINDTFTIKYIDINWELLSSPLYHYFSGVDIVAGSTERVKLFVQPAGNNMPFGNYRLDLTVSSNEGKSSAKVPLYIQIRSEKPLISEYLAAVSKIVEIPAGISPKGEFAVSVNLLNRNPKNITDLEVLLTSRLFSREVHTSLPPLESRNITEVFSIDPLTPPQRDVLNVKLILDGQILSPEINEPYEISAYSEIVEVSSNTKKSFLKTKYTAAYRNDGNVENSKVVEVKTNSLKNLFTDSESAIKISRPEGKYLAWELNLQPSQEVAIGYTRSYRGLFFSILTLAVAVALYYLMRSPVTAAKRAGIINASNGGISEFRIFIHIKNRSSKNFERFTVTDTLPIMASVSVDSQPGTVAPASIYNDGEKTVIKWELDTIEAKEERILSYKVKSKLSVIGDVSLPKANVRFFSKRGTKIVTQSKPVSLRI